MQYIGGKGGWILISNKKEILKRTYLLEAIFIFVIMEPLVIIKDLILFLELFIIILSKDQ